MTNTAVRDYQYGYALAMLHNGSLNVPIGSGRAAIECELAKNFKRPLYVSTRKEMIMQFERVAKEMGISVSTCHVSKFEDKVKEISPDCVIACETILQYSRYTDLVTNCGAKVWMNRSVYE